jgi:chorismate dehydratase
MVTLGHINYLNCLPVHSGILLNKVPFNGKIVKGTPKQLNQLLEKGEIDISPSSSVEIVKGHFIVPGLSISSKTDVQSIVLFTKVPLNTLKKGKILISSHSSTSSLLVKIIFKELYNAQPTFKIFTPEKKPIDNEIVGILHIGDIALEYNLNNTLSADFPYKYDLASIWYEAYNLPFTFALWQVPITSISKDGLKDAIEALHKSYDFYLKNQLYTLKAFVKDYQIAPERILAYWDRLDYTLTKNHIDSLKLFFKLLKKHGFIEKVPTFNFI